jgi:glutamine synthetase
MSEVLLTDMTPHPSNTRAALAAADAEFADQEPLFGIEQEYTLFQGGRPLGFPEGGFPAPQGPYYCSVGAGAAYGRPLAEAHLDACLKAGLGISGINAEVMPGQWEFQVGPLGPLAVADQLWVARWLLQRLGEELGIAVSFDPKPISGDWNGAGAHTNFSTKAMRASYEAVIAAAEALGKNAEHHVFNYGEGIEDRLTGSHETAPWDQFSYGVSDRGASVRIPWQVEKEGGGYLEDRRPNANCDPYVVARLMLESCCPALA